MNKPIVIFSYIPDGYIKSYIRGKLILKPRWKRVLKVVNSDFIPNLPKQSINQLTINL